MPAVSAHRVTDVAIIGGGPAAVAASTLLSRWRHDVLVLTRPAPAGPSLAESLPPSIEKPLAAVGLNRSVLRAGFYRTYGNTVWWGEDQQRSEPFADGAWGYQVIRKSFDDRLLEEAVAAGVTVIRDAHVQSVDLEASPPRLVYESRAGDRVTVEARMVLDCSGRAGVIARQEGCRVQDEERSTVALVGIWRCNAGWDVPDPTHTLVESYADGWAWSVPVSHTDRYVTVMVDPRTTALSRTGAVDGTYRAELAKTTRLAHLVDDARPIGHGWGRDASVYSANQVGGPGFLLVGDAVSFVDPLSSFGVRKALTSAWLAAVVTRTRLRRREMDAPALQLFATREREVFDLHTRRAATFFANASHRHVHPFWTDRAEPTDSSRPSADKELDHEVHSFRSDPAVLGALNDLQRAPSVRLRRTGAVTLTTHPAVRNDEVVLEPRVVIAGWPAGERGIRFLRGVDLSHLVSIADRHSQVPDLFDAYQRDRPPVPLADFLGALAVLVSKGALRDVGDEST